MSIDKFKQATKFIALSAAAFIYISPSFSAEYRLDTGDVLQISVIGVPEFQVRAVIGLDGTVSVPLLGPISVIGMQLSDLRARIQELLPTKGIRTRGVDGRENVIVIPRDAISVNVSEYRPVYIHGDVAKPGELVYRPGTTVRQAIALAGGYDLVRFRMTNPFLEAADLKSQNETFWIEHVKEQANTWRIEAELRNSPVLGHNELPKALIAETVISQIVSLAADKLAAIRKNYEGDKSSLGREIQQADEQIAFLIQQQQKQQEEINLGSGEFESLRDFKDRGLVTQKRVTEERRATLIATTQLLYTLSRIVEVKREREDLSRKLRKLDDQRRIELTQELQDARVRLAVVRSRLEANSEKMLYTGALKSQLVRGKGAVPQINVFRKMEDAQRRLAGDEDTVLMPGDVVEVALNYAIEGPGQY